MSTPPMVSPYFTDEDELRRKAIQGGMLGGQVAPPTPKPVQLGPLPPEQTQLMGATPQPTPTAPKFDPQQEYLKQVQLGAPTPQQAAPDTRNKFVRGIESFGAGLLGGYPEMQNEWNRNQVNADKTNATQLGAYNSRLGELKGAADEESQQGLRQAEADKDAAEAKKAGQPTPVKMQRAVIEGPDGNPRAVDYNPQSGAFVDPDTQQVISGAKPFTKAAPTPEHEQRAVTLQLPNGSKAAGKTDFNGNLLTADGQPAPKGTVLYQQPNYGQLVMPTKTQDIIGPNGLPTVMSWNAKTQAYDIPQGTAGGGAIGHEMGQASIVKTAGDDLITLINANRNKVGNVGAIINSAFLGTPLADPQQSRIASQIASFAALNPAMHGMRGAKALDEFKKLVGGIPNNPDAMIAAIQGIQSTASAINPKANQAPTGADNEVYAPDGVTLIGHSVKGVYVPLKK